MPNTSAGSWQARSIRRREFISRAAMGALASSIIHPTAGAKSSKVAFNTANLVARVTGYRYQLVNWMAQHQQTVAATDAAAWRSICGEIAAAGFGAIEVWEAHASPETLDKKKTKEWRKISEGAGLKAIAYAGHLSRETLQICGWFGIPHIDGGLGNLSPDQATALCRESGIRFNIENHPEKSADEILKKIGGGNEWLGVCIDMGWLGTQGVSAPDVTRACGARVRHTHVKDVMAAGKHETCLLGDGIVRVAECLQVLRSLDYKGWYSWEDEPEDRNPFDSAKQNLLWLRQNL